MKRFLQVSSVAALVAFLASYAGAQQNFPTKPVRLLIPYAAGGAVDILGRTIGDELSKRWKQPVIIENRTGAGGTIASQVIVKSPPDGYTLVIVSSGHSINPYLYSNLPYDTFKDFKAISLLGSSPNMMLVSAKSPFKSVGDVLAAARAKPGSLSYGMSGTGTSTHLAGELFKYMAKVDIVAVAYKGGAPIINDLLGGHLPLSFNNIPESMGQINAGTVRPLGVTTTTRSAVLPNVPTIAEAGVPGYDTMVWWGMLGPAGLSDELTAKISKDCAEALKAPAVKQRLDNLGAVVAGTTPAEFSKLIRADYEKWGPIIKAAGMKGE
ncbi:MAG TPA: tripartite tricarboxylate transporter substrate binding protein [Thermodesulfobacteriota bacterium]|nr:tripartite tricarboxylate transporter substrate binding protein [Thermodesulfobacteriota bacterium]